MRDWLKRMTSDDWSILGDRCVVIVCCVIALLYSIGVIA